MKTVKIEPFMIMGISTRTTNEGGQAGKDIVALWDKFRSESVADKIPGKINEKVYSTYTNYAGDHTKPYDVILGCQVNSLENIPEGMVGKMIEGGDYQQFVAKGNLKEGIIFDAWMNIWEAKLNRAFSADFEEWGEKAQNPLDAEVDIFIAVKNE